jgi:hypothetical protein
MADILVFDGLMDNQSADEIEAAVIRLVEANPPTNDLQVQLDDLSNKGLRKALNYIESKVPALGRVSVISIAPWAKVPRIHTHDGQMAVVYYPRAIWKPEWAGGIVFFDGHKSRITGLIPYTPRRFIVIPGDLTHAMLPTLADAPEFRLSLVFFYVDK